MQGRDRQLSQSVESVSQSGVFIDSKMPDLRRRLGWARDGISKGAHVNRDAPQGPTGTGQHGIITQRQVVRLWGDGGLTGPPRLSNVPCPASHGNAVPDAPFPSARGRGCGVKGAGPFRSPGWALFSPFPGFDVHRIFVAGRRSDAHCRALRPDSDTLRLARARVVPAADGIVSKCISKVARPLPGPHPSACLCPTAVPAGPTTPADATCSRPDLACRIPHPRLLSSERKSTPWSN